LRYYLNGYKLGLLRTNNSTTFINFCGDTWHAKWYSAAGNGSKPRNNTSHSQEAHFKIIVNTESKGVRTNYSKVRITHNLLMRPFIVQLIYRTEAIKCIKAKATWYCVLTTWSPRDADSWRKRNFRSQCILFTLTDLTKRNANHILSYCHLPVS
jgi:hypothetical protein